MDLNEWRKQKNDFFRSVDSPLTAEQRLAFTGLLYFPEDPTLRFVLPLQLPVAEQTTIMSTSTGDQRTYRMAGTVTFSVHGHAVTMTVYQDPTGYFLPFRDGTNDDATYPAGRYLEPEEIEPGKLRMDFNQAYNPYCAYNEQYSCPLPPAENWSKVSIDAGEKRFV